jgi:hypothetical protein
MKKLQTEQMENVVGGRRFWGAEVTSCTQGIGYKWKCQQTYIFWIGMGTACGASGNCEVG